MKKGLVLTTFDLGIAEDQVNIVFLFNIMNKLLNIPWNFCKKILDKPETWILIPTVKINTIYCYWVLITTLVSWLSVNLNTSKDRLLPILQCLLLVFLQVLHKEVWFHKLFSAVLRIWTTHIFSPGQNIWLVTKVRVPSSCAENYKQTFFTMNISILPLR